MRLPVWPALMVLATALMAGLGDGSLAALLPTFGLDHGFAEADALTLLTAFVAGGIVFQWPVGWLADRSQRAHARPHLHCSARPGCWRCCRSRCTTLPCACRSASWPAGSSCRSAHSA